MAAITAESKNVFFFLCCMFSFSFYVCQCTDVQSFVLTSLALIVHVTEVFRTLVDTLVLKGNTCHVSCLSHGDCNLIYLLYLLSVHMYVCLVLPYIHTSEKKARECHIFTMELCCCFQWGYQESNKYAKYTLCLSRT